MSKKRELGRKLARSLFVWSYASIMIGVLLYLFGAPFLQGIGLQALLWGSIDAVIAAFTLLKQQDSPATKLAKILLVNIGLDVAYQSAGVLVLIFLGQDPFLAGNGVGVIIQGAFLFFLDLYFYHQMKKITSSDEKE